MIVVQLTHALYIFTVRPFESRINNLVECINETFFTFFVGFLMRYNSTQRWTEVPELAYLWSMAFNNFVVVLIIVGKYHFGC